MFAPKQSGVYQIANLANGKLYIGSALDLARRWKKHQTDLARGEHHNRILQYAWNKYGTAAFVFRPLLTCQKSMLRFYEQQLLDKARPEYNICMDAKTRLGVKSPPETGAKISAALRGKRASPETRAKMSRDRKGCRLSAEHRAKISLAGMGRRPTEETRRKLSAAAMGNTKGRACKGRPFSVEHCANIAAGKLGRPWSTARRVAFESRQLAGALL